jgi:putative addiction module antidote
MTTTNLTQIGPAVGIVLPPDVLKRLNIASGDQVCLIDTPNGVEITSLAPLQAEQLQVARQIIAENREALQELAK